MDRILIATYEELIIERSTPVSTSPVKVQFSFLIGYDVFLAVTAEVTEERDGDGITGHNVIILECFEDIGGCELYPYEKGMETLRESLEKEAIVHSQHRKYHVR